MTKREETRQLNSFLETMQAQIYEAQRELLNKGKEVTIKAVRNIMHGIGDCTGKTQPPYWRKVSHPDLL